MRLNINFNFTSLPKEDNGTMRSKDVILGSIKCFVEIKKFPATFTYRLGFLPVEAESKDSLLEVILNKSVVVSTLYNNKKYEIFRQTDCCNTWTTSKSCAVLNTVIDNVIIDLSIQINKIKGLVQFPICQFKNPEFKTSDLVINLNSSKYYCHSQILGFHSTLLKQKLEELEQKCKEVEIEAEFEDEHFMTFLYTLYGYKDMIHVDNVVPVLNISGHMDAPMVLRACEEFLLKLEEKDFSRQISLLLAWKFDLDSLKMSSLNHFKKLEELRECFSMDLYQDLSINAKLELCEIIVKHFSF